MKRKTLFMRMGILLLAVCILFTGVGLASAGDAPSTEPPADTLVGNAAPGDGYGGPDGKQGTGESDAPAGDTTTPLVPEGEPPVPASATVKTITAFDALAEGVAKTQASTGTEISGFELPDKLKATVNGAATDVPVKAWEAKKDTIAYDKDTAGDYILTPVFGEGYALDLGTDEAGKAILPPEITVTLAAPAQAKTPAEKPEEPDNPAEPPSKNTAKTITAFAALLEDVQTQIVQPGALKDDLHLPDALAATIDDGYGGPGVAGATDGAGATGKAETITGVTWTCETYDETTGMTEGEYEWTPVLPDGYALELGVDENGDAILPPVITAQVGGLLMSPMGVDDPYLSIGGIDGDIFDGVNKRDGTWVNASYTASNNRLTLRGPVGAIDARNLGADFTVYLETQAVVVGSGAATNITALSVLAGSITIDGPGKAEIYGALDIGGNITFQNGSIQIISTGGFGAKASGQCFFAGGDLRILAIGGTGLALDDNVFFVSGCSTILGLSSPTNSTGIYGLKTEYGNVYVYDGNHTVVGTGTGAADWGMYVPRGQLDVSGGKLTVIGPSAGGLAVEGGNITVSDGMLEGAGTTLGIRTSRDIYIQNGAMNAFARATAPTDGWDALYRGLFDAAQGDMTGKALDVFLSAPITGGSASGTALDARGAISILNSSVNASALLGPGGANAQAKGIHADQTITINGSTVAALADTGGDSSRAVGIHAGVAGTSPGLIQMTDSKVMAYARNATARYAMFVEDAGQYLGEIQALNMNIVAGDTPPGETIPVYSKTNMTGYPYVYLGAGNTIAFATNGVTASGVTATGNFSPASPQVPGTSMTVTITLTGTAAAAGTHTVGLESATLGDTIIPPATVTKTVVAGQAMGAGDAYRFIFTMPNRAVEDLVVTHTFASGSKAITSFTLAGASGDIDEGAGTIALTLPYGTDVTALTPSITHTGVSISPTGAQNFTNPVTYTVTAADGTTKQYVVTVTVEKPAVYQFTATFPTVADRTKPVTGTVDGPFAAFTGLLVNNKALREGVDFEKASGSTVITLLPAYLATLQNGTYSVVAQFSSGAAATTLKVDAPIAVTGIKADPSMGTNVRVPVGGTAQLKVVLTPDNAANKTVTWMSSDPNVATVDSNGLVRGIKVGSVTITATTVDGGFTATFTVTVTAAAVSPQTGDNENLSLWIALCMMAGVAIVYVLQKRREKVVK